MDVINDQDLSKRFIVLVSDHVVNNNDLARAIYWMAEQEHVSVLYLVLVDGEDNMLAVTRNMVTMKAMTSANRLPVETKIIETGHWLETLTTITSPGDVIICQEEQVVVTGSFKTIPVSEFLSSRFDVPIRTISGFSNPFQTPAKKRLNEFFALLGFLVIMAVFTWLQINVNQTLDGSVAKIFVFITFCIEMGAVWVWYKFAYL